MAEINLSEIQEAVAKGEMSEAEERRAYKACTGAVEYVVGHLDELKICHLLTVIMSLINMTYMREGQACPFPGNNLPPNKPRHH